MSKYAKYKIQLSPLHWRDSVQERQRVPAAELRFSGTPKQDAKVNAVFFEFSLVVGVKEYCCEKHSREKKLFRTKFPCGLSVSHRRLPERLLLRKMYCWKELFFFLDVWTVFAWNYTINWDEFSLNEIKKVFGTFEKSWFHNFKLETLDFKPHFRLEVQSTSCWQSPLGGYNVWNIHTK